MKASLSAAAVAGVNAAPLAAGQDQGERSGAPATAGAGDGVGSVADPAASAQGKGGLLAAVRFFLVMTLLFGVAYTGVCTALCQVAFPFQANGSVITGTDGKQYSTLVGQDFSAPDHMWGRVMNVDVSTFTDDQGNPLAWAAPSNTSPASEEYQQAVAERVERIRAAHPEKADQPVPSDLVTCSGSGLDPHISPAAAEYQVQRLSRETGMSEDQVRSIVDACTEHPFLGLFGQDHVNVVKVNLMLDGIVVEA